MTEPSYNVTSVKILDMPVPVPLLQDTRPIDWIAWGSGEEAMYEKVGRNGVTRIVAYAENGQMAHVPWVAIYKGDVLWLRVDAANKDIGYSVKSG